MRPASMLLFDRFFLSSLAVGLVNSVHSYYDILDRLKADPASAQMGFGAGFIITVAIFLFGITLLLWFLISRRASKVAKWILVVMTVLGLLAMIPTLPIFMQRSGPELFLVALVTVLQLIAVALLFRNDARVWFASGGEASESDPDIFS